MALYVTQTPYPPPPTEAANGEITAYSLSTYEGVYRQIVGVNSLYLYNRRGTVQTAWDAPELISVSARKQFYLMVDRPDGRTSTDADDYEVWLWVVRTDSHPTSDWSIAAENTTLGTANTYQVNGGTATTGSWTSLGVVRISHSTSSFYQEIAIETKTATGLTSGDGVYAVAVIPKANKTYMPSVVGGYDNSFFPLNSWEGGADTPLTVALLSSLQKNASIIYRYGGGQILASDWTRTFQAAHLDSDPVYIYDRHRAIKAEGVNSIFLYGRCYSDNSTSLTRSTFWAKVKVGEETYVEASTTVTAAATYGLSLNILGVPTGTIMEVQIGVNRGGTTTATNTYFDLISAFHWRASYE